MAGVAARGPHVLRRLGVPVVVWLLYLALVLLGKDLPTSLVLPLGSIPVLVSGLWLGPIGGPTSTAIAILGIWVLQSATAPAQAADVLRNQGLRWTLGLVLSSAAGVGASAYRRLQVNGRGPREAVKRGERRQRRP